MTIVLNERKGLIIKTNKNIEETAKIIGFNGEYKMNRTYLLIDEETGEEVRMVKWRQLSKAERELRARRIEQNSKWKDLNKPYYFETK